MARVLTAAVRGGGRTSGGPVASASPVVPSPATFTNPLYAGADPWVVFRNGRYFLCQSGPQGIEIWTSPTLTDRGVRRVVWAPPATGWNRAQVWAPELHYLRGRWYIYYAASTGRNPTHRMGVLESTTDDAQSPFVDRGMLYTGDDLARGTGNRWAIDGTVLELRGELYLLWSGWPVDGVDVQHLYAAPMSDPRTICGNRVRLCANDTYAWEHVGESRRDRGLHEAPQVLHRNGKVFLVYSTSGSWQPTYKLGMLVMDASADPLEPASWRKLETPVFEPTTEVFGVGHCCFTQSPDGKEDWLVYHAKRYRRSGWDRVVRAQRFTWRADGLPDFGVPVPSWQAVDAPSGDRAVPDRMPPLAA